MHRLAFCLAVLATAASLVPCAWAQGQNMFLLGQWDLRDTPGAVVQYNDVWGYVDEFGSEYAILGVWNGTSVINVTDPAQPYETGFFPGVSSIWRDMKTYGDHAYVVNESGGGMLILDLTDPENPQVAGNYGGFSTAHNIYIDEAAGRAYPCGTDVGGTPILDLGNPTSPQWLGNWGSSYVHDLFVRDGKAYLAEINNPSFVVVDVSNPANPVAISSHITYPDAFTHNTWLTDDSNYLLTTDENTGGHPRIWDISDLANITQVGEWTSGNSSIVHNVMVKGDFAYASWYGKGLLVADISDPTDPQQIGSYDTSTQSGFDGAWGLYPFLPSGNILVSDTANGLFILDFRPPATVTVNVTDGTDASPIEGAHVELVEAAKVGVTNATGDFDFGQVTPASYTLRVQYEGYFDHEETIDPIASTTLNASVVLQRLPGGPISGATVVEETSKMALEETELELLGTRYVAESDPTGQYLFPHVPYGSYTLRATREGYGQREFDVELTTGGLTLEVPLVASFFYDIADADLGWAIGEPSDTATRGQWARVVPIPSGGGTVQPGDDATPGTSGGLCFVTANAPDETWGTGAADVDKGITTLTSPLIAAAGLTDPWIGYNRWYISDPNGGGNDPFVVSISNDDGQSWSVVESITTNETPWTRVLFRIGDFLTPTDQMRVRFLAQDNGVPHVVEALVDDVEIFGTAPAPTATESIPSPVSALLESAFPNPFNPSTELRFSMTREGHAELRVMDSRGRLVSTLVNDKLGAGEHSVRWNGLDERGRPAASGVYMAVFDALSTRTVRKLTLAK